MPAFPAFRTKPYYDALKTWLTTSLNEDGTLKDSAVQEKVSAAIAADPTVVQAAADAVDANPTIASLTPAEGEVVTNDGSGPVGWNNGVFDASHPRWGIVGDGVADDTAALQAMADACRAYTETGTPSNWAQKVTFRIPATMRCRITSQLNLRYIRDVDVRGRIVVAHTDDVGVLVGGYSSQTLHSMIFLNEVDHAVSSQTNVTVRVMGLKNGTVTVGRTDYLQLYADYRVGTDSSIAYSTFYLGDLDTLELLGEPGGASWINENDFHRGRISLLRIICTDGYWHNNNRFHAPNLEAATVEMDGASSNLIDNVRGEGGTVYTFSARTRQNTVVGMWASNDASINAIVSAGSTDLGADNRIYHVRQAAGTLRTIVRVDASTPLTDTASSLLVGTGRPTPGFRKVFQEGAWNDTFDTGLMRIREAASSVYADSAADLNHITFRSDAEIWRPRIEVYDANRQKLTDGDVTQYISLTGGLSWNAANSYYTLSANVSHWRVVILHPNVTFVRIRPSGGGASTANRWFRYAEISAYIQPPSGDGLLDAAIRQMRRPLYQTGTTPPAKSLLYPGDSIGTDTGRLQLTHRVDTTLSAAALSGATTIDVASITGIASGDTIAVLLADDTTHFTTVSGAPAGSTVTLTAALPGAANSGANVATQRWLHIT